MSKGNSSKIAKAERRKKRTRSSVVSLNLTSLMDIFTILVFFLLVNSSQEQPPSNKDITLPTSSANQEVKKTAVITVTRKNILFQGKQVLNIDDALALSQDLIPELAEELRVHSTELRETVSDPIKASEITIMGDQDIPYSLLKKLMFTCTDSQFSRISLAVLKKPGDA